MFLLSFVERLKHRKVKIFTDTRVLPENFPLVALRSIQSVNLSTFHVWFSHGIALEAHWIPRSLNGKADLLRRFIDEDDSPANSSVF